MLIGMATEAEFESNGAHGMRFPVSFYRFGAVCSWLSKRLSRP